MRLDGDGRKKMLKKLMIFKQNKIEKIKKLFKQKKPKVVLGQLQLLMMLKDLF